MNLQQSESRIEWVDLCKGFAIQLVMLGHTYCNFYIKIWLYSFHIPLFFFLSGYVFSIKKYVDFKTFLVTKLKTLIFPMLIMGTIVSFFEWLIDPSMRLAVFVVNKILGIFIQLRGSTFDFGLWYIACLFVVEVAMFFLIKFSKENNKVMLVIYLLLSLVGYAYCYKISKICPWSLENACVLLLFFGSGYIIKERKIGWFDKIVNIYSMLLFMIINISCVLIHYKMFNKTIDVYSQNIGIYPLFYIGGFAGILATIIFFRYVKKNRVLSFIGKNSFVFYAFHQFLFRMFDNIRVFKTNYVGLGILYVVIANVIITVIVFIINCHAPWILGKRRVSKT